MERCREQSNTREYGKTERDSGMEYAQKQYHHEVYANDIDLMIHHLRAALRAAFFVEKANETIGI